MTRREGRFGGSHWSELDVVGHQGECRLCRLQADQLDLVEVRYDDTVHVSRRGVTELTELAEDAMRLVNTRDVCLCHLLSTTR